MPAAVILYHPERKVKTGINLLAPEERIMQSWDLGANIRAKPKEGAEGSEEDEKADSSTKKIVSYFKPNTTIEIVDDFTAYNADQIIPQVTLLSLTRSVCRDKLKQQQSLIGSSGMLMNLGILGGFVQSCGNGL